MPKKEARQADARFVITFDSDTERREAIAAMAEELQWTPKVIDVATDKEIPNPLSKRDVLEQQVLQYVRNVIANVKNKRAQQVMAEQPLPDVELNLDGVE